MPAAELIDAYLDGPRLLREAVAGMSDAQLDAQPVPGKMTTREVVCHLADFELVGADRMKRVLFEDRPTLPGYDENAVRRALAYDRRDVSEELELIALVRRQMGRILRALPSSAWSRVGVHTEAGELTLEALLARATNHIPHHVAFIAEKRRALAGH